MPLFLHDLTLIGASALCVIAFLIACAFEMINGFHDTANAVATVIYTRALSPWKAVILSGICNFLGVFLGGTAVAIGIIRLLPTEALAGGGEGIAMVLALLVAAIIWNLGTWYLGIPCSSSHTLIGAIVGVGLACSLLPGHVFGEGVHWTKVEEVALALLISPLIGFLFSYALLFLLKKIVRAPELYAPPVGDAVPPWWIRLLLILTCSGVSLAHGSNDGQKGIGLFMLILVAFLPVHFALNLHQSPAAFERSREALVEIRQLFETRTEAANIDPLLKIRFHSMEKELDHLLEMIPINGNLQSIPANQRLAMRRDLLTIDDELIALRRERITGFSTEERTQLSRALTQAEAITDYAPRWAMALTAFFLGVGTMIGWKRIVVTVGEKIGQQHLTYAQGATAEVVAMGTIGFSSFFGLPVSTTQVLSSGVAGTMVEEKAGLQLATVNRIALAWVLTLPASILLSGLLFSLFLSLLRLFHS